MSELQAAEWRLQQAVARKAMEIETRIAHGATVEPGELVFDGELKMVRTGKVKAG